MLISGLVVALALGGVGCSTTNRFKPTGNPLLDVRNPQLLDRDRVAAAEAAWGEVEAGTRVRERTRDAFKALAWSRATEEPVRLTLVRLLMSDSSAEGADDSERMARLMLPTERSPAVIRALGDAAVEQGWTGVVPSLVRSYARSSPNVPDNDRSERGAIEALSGGASVEEVVYRVFLTPGADGDSDVEGAVLRTAERTRDDAWTLLSRLDLDGRIRAGLIARPVPAGATVQAEREVEMLRAGLRELGVLPRTGDELAWMRRLWGGAEREIDREANRAWWGQAAEAVAALNEEAKRGLELRHLEAVRWAWETGSAWMGMGRGALQSELETRVRDRAHYTRRGEKGRAPRPEDPRDWAQAMAWGDVLTVLVIEQALSSDSVRGQVFEQSVLDRADTTTEYGGVIEHDRDDRARAVLFRPRSRDRQGDEMFVASGDMVRFSDRALAHYHMQVSEKRLARLAGPSIGDLGYAERSGRTCLVFTSVGSDALNVDAYTPDGQVVDLGLLVPGGWSR